MSVENVKKALTILEMELTPLTQYSIRDVKRQYKKLALKYHPDKSDIHNTGKFQRICEAKEYLINNIHNINSNSSSPKNDNDFILSEIDTLCIMYNVMYKGVFTYRVKKKISNDNGLPDYMANFVLDNMLRLIEKKIKDNEILNSNTKIILLRPSLCDLLNDNLFIYRTKSMTFYIPLWHKDITLYDDKIEMEYVFIIIPDFTSIKNNSPIISQVCIDDSNNLYLHLTEYVSQLTIGSKIFTFPSFINDGQYTFNGEGISHTNNEKNIYDISSRSNVFIRIH
jgi:hypothetical protein